MSTNLLKSLVAVVCLLFIPHWGNATLIVPTKSTLHSVVGSTVVPVGSTTSISAPADAATYTDVSKKGLLTLGVDHHFPEVVASGHTTVVIQVTTYNTVGGSPNTPFNVTLDVDYTPGNLSFADKQTVELDGILAYSIQIISINGSTSTATNLAKNLYIDAELFIDRVYDFSDYVDEIVIVETFGSDKIVYQDCDEVKDRLLVRWTPIKEAEEYQLEWTYVNDYAETAGDYKADNEVHFDFRFNASRISTAEFQYEIPLTYDHGYVVYRVRAVGRYISDPTKRQYSLWSLPQNGEVHPDAGADYYYIEEPWEISKNWQYSVSFAEEGKRKEVVSFFDGSLRNRQMVTLVSTNTKAIVGETIYDYQGRPAIQVLPAPVPASTCNGQVNSLKYYEDFNRTINGTEPAYSRADFDISVSACSNPTAAMSAESGASNYYSDLNIENTDAQAYLPDAAGYPFSQVEYTPDNTGRIRRQGGVGEEFQLGSDHESKYFYGHPSQVELDRLFGSEVGYAKHYQKNMVMDPNGQVSVSYLDQEGRVIATALAGEAPDSLIALESLPDNPLHLKDDILLETDQTANEYTTDSLSKSVIQTVLVSAKTDITISYRETIGMFTDECLADDICFGCVYDLTINFRDQCGVSLVPTGYADTLTGTFTYLEENDSIVFSMICDDPGSPYGYDITLTDVPVGSYQLTKTLHLNAKALNFYEKQYMDTLVNECFKTLEDFQEEYLADADYSGCVPDTTCEQCLENLPTEVAFVSGGYGTAEDYLLLQEHCKALCEPVSMYEAYRGLLLADVSPLGQYGEYLLANGTFHPEEFLLSVYNDGNHLPRTYIDMLANSDWQNPVFEHHNSVPATTTNHYYDENLLTESKVELANVVVVGGSVTSSEPEIVNGGSGYYTYDSGSGTYWTTPENLAHVEDFIDLFQPSWARSLIYYHPEYRMLETYYQLTIEDANGHSSESFDALLDQTDTWQEAIDADLIKTGIVTATPINSRLEDFGTISTSHAYDPFLIAMYDSDNWLAFKNLLLAKMGLYSTIGINDYSMAEIAAMTGRCGTQIGTTPGSDCFGFGNDASTATYGGITLADVEARNQDWLNFKAYYRSAKQEFISQLALKRSIETSDYYGYNGCIANSNFNPFLGGFFDPTEIGSGNTQYLNEAQPCSVNNAPLYKYKAKRFMLPSDASGNGDGYNYNIDPLELTSEVAYNEYITTGDCPLATGFENLADDLALDGNLTAASYGLTNSEDFVQFIHALNGWTNPPAALPALTWNATVTNDSTLNITILNPSLATVGTIVFHLEEDSLIVWDSIREIINIHTVSTGGLGYTFTGKAVYHTNDSIAYYPLSGSTSFDILNCSFPDVCTLNELGEDLFDLFNVVATDFKPVSPYCLKGALEIPNAAVFVTDRVGELLSGTTTPSAEVYWGYASGKFKLYDATNSNKIELTIATTPFTAYSTIAGFSSMEVVDATTFILTAVDGSGAFLTTLTCNVDLFAPSKTPLDIGLCGQPVLGCNDQPAVNFTEISDLLEDVLLNQAPAYDLFASTYMTNNLAGQLNGATSISSSSGIELVYTDGLSVTPVHFTHQTELLWGDTLITQTYYQEITTTHVLVYKDSVACGPGEEGAECDSVRIPYSNSRANPVKLNVTTFSLGDDCDLVLKLREDPLLGYTLDDITEVFSFEAVGETDLNGEYHEFEMVVELDNSITDTVFGFICLPIRPCEQLETTFNGIEPFPNIIIEEPCSAIVTAMAMASAEEAYYDYVDSLMTDFRARYITHCMSTVEEFSRTADQSEYHFTLYYYDQAGNLVKTVPPEGVEQLDIVSALSPLESSVRADRVNGTHLVLTDHRMATVYTYNSLNQLVAQHMPDQDVMSSWKQTTASGLDVKLNTTAVQMLDASVGYLAGYVTETTTPMGTRGYLYKTTDGGSNWTRIENLLAFDLQKVRMISSTTGFAVGKSGIALRTINGGQTWDMLNMHGINVTGNFVDLSFKSATDGAFLLADGRVVQYKIVTGTLSMYVVTPSLSGYTLVAGQSIVEIGGTGTATYVVGEQVNTGGAAFTQLWRITLPASTSSVTATPEDIKGVQWSSVSYASSTLGFVGGVDGDLLALTESGTTGTQVLHSADNNTGTILETAFWGSLTGVAIIRSTAGQSYLYKTTDGGDSWAQVSGTQCVSMTTITQSGSDIVVAGSFTNNTVQCYNISLFSSTQLWSYSTGSLIFDKMTKYIKNGRCYLLGTTGLKIYEVSYTSTTGTTAPTTHSTYYTASGGTAPTSLKACFIVDVSSNTMLHVVTVRNDGTGVVVSDLHSYNGGAAALKTISPSSTTFKDVAIVDGTTTPYILGYEHANQKIHRLLITTATPTGGGLAAFPNNTSANLPSGGSFIAMGLHSDYVTLVGADGQIYSSTTAITSGISIATQISWANRSALRTAPLNALTGTSFTASSIAYNGLAVGDRGVILRRASSATTWQIVPAEKTTNLLGVSSITISSVPIAYVVGKSLTAFRMTLTSSATSSITLGGSPSGHLTDVALGTNAANSSYVAYVVGTGGKSYYTATINPAGSPSLTASSALGYSINSVAIAPGQTSTPKALCVGDGGKISELSTTAHTPISSLFGPRLNDVHFATSSIGTVGGDNFFVRSTVNTGGTWIKVMPSTVNNTTLTVAVKNVWTKPTAASAHYALLTGASYLAGCFGNVATPDLTFAALGLTVNDIKFGITNPLIGYMGANTSLKKIELTVAGTSYTFAVTDALLGGTVPATINALHIFNNTSATDEVMVVGNNMIRYKAPGATTTISMATGVTGTIRDVVFTDASHGYVAGDAGLFYQTDAVTYNTFATAYTAMSWVQKTINDSYSGALSNINVKAISFPTSTKGVWAGDYVSNPLSGYAAVRVLNIQDQLYSARFYYDRLGRIVVSQNSRQKNQNKYSYTLYDALGRVYEAGEKTENTTGTGVPEFAGIFGTSVGGQYVHSVIDDTKLSAWITQQSSTTRKEVTKSYYDNTNAQINANGLSTYSASFFNTETQRKRIVHVTYEETFDVDGSGNPIDSTYDHATHYNYDIHGNVKNLLQENKKMRALANLAHHRYKKLDYVYDLISGNVHRVDYENGKADQWHHAYSYDADNRITDVYTTTATPLTNAARGIYQVMLEPEVSPYWDREAAYSYYDHGPLARTVIGEQEVQGLDYVYTLQGWIKGVNSNDLNISHDPGRDANTSSGNHAVAQDVMGYSLHYFRNDYTPIVSGNSNFVAAQNSSNLTANSYDLFNGNIARMVTTITNPNTRAALPLGNAYKYDQLNRLKQAVSFTNLSSNVWGSSGTAIYGNYFAYDANGNIIKQLRKNESGTTIDSLSYKYHKLSNGKTLRNRLYHVDDNVGDGTFTDDIDDMGTFAGNGTINTANNYVYDEEGRLIKDVQEQIDLIEWRVDGKVKRIERSGEISLRSIRFEYDAMGHRIAKHVYSADEDLLLYSDYYILDAQGNTMSVYRRNIDPGTSTITFAQKEKYIYGSSRLGVLNDSIPMLGSQNNTYSQATWTHTIGNRQYELSNHLGNVLTVISDKPIPHVSSGTTVDYFLADILNTYDYSAFHAPLTARTLTKTSVTKDYRYGGANGQEKVDEVAGKGNHYSAEYWEYDSRLGRRWNPDPVIKVHESPYACFANNPIWFADPNGADTLNGVSLVSDLKSLNAEEGRIKKNRENILLMKANRDKISAQIDHIDNLQEINELMLDISPAHRSSPLSKAVKVHVKANSEALEFLKASYIAMELIIMMDIHKYNQQVEAFNDDVASANLSLALMDGDDALALQNSSEKYYYYSQNHSDKTARYRFTLNGTDYRFGIAPNKEYNSTVITINYQPEIDQIMVSFDKMGLDAASILKQFPQYKKVYDKTAGSVRKQIRKTIK